NASVNAQILTPTALGTIVNDDGPDITIGNVTQAEGNAGTSNFVFTVNLSGPSASDVSFNFATSDVSATTADGDYIATSGSKTILAGNTSTTITVQVVGDNKKEPNETFNVTLSGAVNGNIVGGPGIGTITDDDPTPSISINDVSQAEGNSGLTAFNFTLSLSNPSSQTITVLANTADGTATLADNDYQQIINQTVTFPPGSTSQPFTVNVVGDATTEPDQTFFVNLSGQTNSTILDGQGQGTILNDEGPSVTGTTPTNSQTGVSIGTHMVVTFSMAMDPATFTSGTTVTLSPDPSAGAVSPLMQFFWNGGFTQVTIVFDTKLPVGVHGDDVLAESTIYTVTVKGGAAGVKSSIASGSLQMAGDYVTQFTTTLDATPPTVTSIVPDINNPVPAGTSTFTVTWSEPMNKTQGNVQIQSNGSYQADAQLNPPSSNGMTLGWNGPGTVLTINLTTPLPARGLFRFGTNNFNDLNNNFYDNPNNDQVFVTPAAGDATPPTVVSFYPATGSVGVSRDQEILIGFSEGMWPADLLSAAKITVATNIGVLPVMTREIIDFPGVFIEPLKAWPANATITVTVLNTVRDAAGITKAANQAFTFTVGAGDVVNPPVIDAPFSTLANNDQDLDPNQLQESLVFKNSSSGARAFMNSQSSAPQDLTLVEQATGIPLKGFTADTRNNGLEIRGMQSGSFTGFTVTGGGTMYTLTLNPTLQNTMGVAIASTPINFRVKSTGGNARPRFGGSFDARYKTTPAGIKADLQTWAWDPDGDALTVTATDSTDVGFVKPLVSSGGNFQYNTPGSNEATLPTVGAHVLTITLVDTPGGHSVPLAQKTYKQNAAFMPTLVAPTSTGLGRPVFTWPAVSNNVGHDAMALVIMDNTGNEFYSVIVNKNATTFTVPVDMTLPNGSYQWTLNFFTASDGSFRGNGGGEGNSTLVPFTVP
ncbi:MAG: Ig-like domain-containing protein, partial [Planctomycetes bacterium]|nr:Ig-like domain-containing protein [Planctomycetota bacterium]